MGELRRDEQDDIGELQIGSWLESSDGVFRFIVMTRLRRRRFLSSFVQIAALTLLQPKQRLRNLHWLKAPPRLARGEEDDRNYGVGGPEDSVLESGGGLSLKHGGGAKGEADGPLNAKKKMTEMTIPTADMVSIGEEGVCRNREIDSDLKRDPDGPRLRVKLARPTTRLLLLCLWCYDEAAVGYPVIQRQDRLIMS